MSENTIPYLEKGAAFLRKVPADIFTIKSWESECPLGEFNIDAIGTCGFAGCAIGWFIQAKLFDDLYFIGRGYMRRPFYHGKTGYYAASELFDIGCDATEHLFSPAAYPSWGATPAEVADRIDRFIAHLKATGEELIEPTSEE